MLRSTLLLISAVTCFAFISCNSENENKPATAESPAAKEPEIKEGSPEWMGKRIAEMVIANDRAGLTSLIITKEEMTKAIQGSTAPANGKEFAISRIDEEIKIMQKDIGGGFDSVRLKGTEAGIIWENCRFKQAIPTVDDSRGFQMLTVKCIVECNGQEHYFTMTDIVGTDSGWKFGGRLWWKDPVMISGGFKLK